MSACPHTAPHVSAVAARSARRCSKQRTELRRLQPALPHRIPFRLNAQTRLACPVSASFADNDWDRRASRFVSSFDHECHSSTRLSRLMSFALASGVTCFRHSSREYGQVAPSPCASLKTSLSASSGTCRACFARKRRGLSQACGVAKSRDSCRLANRLSQRFCFV